MAPSTPASGEPGRGEHPPGLRWLRMAARIDAALSASGLSAEEARLVLEAHRRAGLHRATLLPPDEDDPRWLHPGRMVVVLLDDAEGVEPRWLALASGLDQGNPELMEPAWRRLLGDEGVPFLDGRGVPDPESDEAHAWLESVLFLDSSVQAVLLVDWLDHLRHLHLQPPGASRDAMVAWARTALLPLARRLGGTLERRFAWWCTRSSLGRKGAP